MLAFFIELQILIFLLLNEQFNNEQYGIDKLFVKIDRYMFEVTKSDKRFIIERYTCCEI